MKLKAKDIMKKPIKVHADTTLAEILEIMEKRNVSSVLVLDKGKPLGVISETDILREVARGCDKTRLAKEIATKSLVAVDEETDITEVCKIMDKWNIRRVFVKKNDEIVGVVKLSDIIKEIAKL